MSGVVFDSVLSRVLAGATVKLLTVGGDADARSAVTDTSGRYAFEDVPAGRHLVGFMHPALETMALEPPAYVIQVRVQAPVILDLATPAPGRLKRGWCGADADGVLVGRLVDARTGALVSGGTVSARWWQLGVTSHGLVRDSRVARTTTREDGSFAVCGMPAGSQILVRGSRGTDSTGDFTIAVPVTGVAYRDVFVAETERVGPGASRDSRLDRRGATPVAWRRGPGTLTGSVRTATGASLAGARVSVLDAGLEAITDAQGEFTLHTLPLGTHTLVTRALGYLPEERSIDILARESTPLHVQLLTVRSVLDTIRVLARRPVRHELEALAYRKEAGPAGLFFSRQQIESHRLLHLSELFRRTPGMSPVRTDGGRMALNVRGTVCLPTLYVDGYEIRVYDDLRDIDDFVRPEDVEGVELYTAGEAPREFTRFGSCVSVIVWTKRTSR